MDYEHNPELDAFLQQLLGGQPRKAKPGDKKGGKLDGQRDQLQKLPNGKMQGHGGEYVVNAEATDAFGPLLEQLNKSVPAKKGVKYEKPKKGKGLWDGGDAPGGAPGGGTSGEGETGPGPGSGPGAAVGGVGDAGPAGPGTGVDMGAPPAGPGAATTGTSIGHSVTGGGGATGAGSIGASTDAASDAAGVAAGPSGDDPGADVGFTANMSGSWGGQTVADALRGFLAAIAPFGLFGPSPNTRGQNIAAHALGTASGIPGVGTGIKGAMGAANNAVTGYAQTLANQTNFGVTPGALAQASAQIGATPGVTNANTGPSSGPGVGGADALPAELQALDALQKETSRISNRATGRSPMEEGLYDLAGRGMQGQNPWALAEAAKPFAGNQSMDSLLAQARKFFAV